MGVWTEYGAPAVREILTVLRFWGARDAVRWTVSEFLAGLRGE